jgi:hypothetical protein
MKRPVRVFRVATGNVATEMIGRILEHCDLELVGLHCYTPEKVGRDAGEIVGLPTIGFVATGTAEEIVAARPDVVPVGSRAPAYRCGIRGQLCDEPLVRMTPVQRAVKGVGRCASRSLM